MKMINKDARQYMINRLDQLYETVLKKCDPVVRFSVGSAYKRGVITHEEYNEAIGWNPVMKGYIGNRRKHNRTPVAVEHNKGKYLTARERNRM